MDVEPCGTLARLLLSERECGKHESASQILADWIKKQGSESRSESTCEQWSEWRVTANRGTLKIRYVLEGPQRSYLILAEERADHRPEELLGLGLTKREAEVLHWIAEGKSNDSIGRILAASRRTIEKHVENILEKLSVESRVEAAMKAVNERRIG